MFCPICGSLAFIGKNQILECSNPDCAYEGPADPKVASISSTTKAKRREFETVEAGPVLGVLTKDDHICPKCESMEVFVELRQTRASDEPETRICTCAQCNHKWREY
ncbi:MAG: transcription factor S [Euryarchaeota archaeon]|nr:transcription factor S [Euryarchaeota archaeon]